MSNFIKTENGVMRLYETVLKDKNGRRIGEAMSLQYNLYNNEGFNEYYFTSSIGKKNDEWKKEKEKIYSYDVEKIEALLVQENI